jgi:Sugar (and other) transporter
MAVSTMTATEVEPRQRLTTWLIGAASVVMLAGALFGYEDRGRVVLGLSVVPALLLVLAMLPLPDSPNWYLKVGRLEDATKTLRKAQPDGDVEAEVAQIQQMWEDRFHRSSHSPQAEKVA